jgi:hypothetical protein
MLCNTPGRARVPNSLVGLYTSASPSRTSASLESSSSVLQQQQAHSQQDRARVAPQRVTGRGSYHGAMQAYLIRGQPSATPVLPHAPATSSTQLASYYSPSRVAGGTPACAKPAAAGAPAAQAAGGGMAGAGASSGGEAASARAGGAAAVPWAPAARGIGPCSWNRSATGCPSTWACCAWACRLVVRFAPPAASTSSLLSYCGRSPSSPTTPASPSPSRKPSESLAVPNSCPSPFAAGCIGALAE